MSKLGFFLRGRLGAASLLLTGSMAAQAISLLVSPVLTRIYAADEWGSYALYTSAIAVLALLSSARYDSAVITPRSDAIARALVALVVLISLAVLPIGAALLIGWSQIAPGVLGEQFGRPWLWVLPLGVFLTAVQTGYTVYLLRNARYGDIAAARIAGSLISAALSVAFGWLHFGVWGLLLSSLAALFIVATMTWAMSGLPLWPRVSRRRLVVVAKRYINYPRVDLPSSLIGVLGSQLPTLLLGACFGSSFLGFYVLVDRVLLAPLNTVGGAIGSVFRVRATKLAATTGGFSQEYSSTFFLLLVPATGIFVPMMIFGEAIFMTIFGAQWSTAGQIAEALSPLYFIRLLASPLSSSLYVRNRMKIDLIGQLMFAASSLASMVIGWSLGDPWVALRLIVVINSSIYAMYLAYGWRIALVESSRGY
ncbi:oligosaccharide flippase family protein [Roseateles oligotrophus]|uniref:Oligosaccharide flippase family protein n=1 Tax=Roseateles oligotrophus TaxID=1769250 RepID=A0ABT2YDX6_9BURK|nr:oligosaccharide flippase family protein [Roseateles oligotrophus]MCV2368256.1 oligosaccharide flippase family protein [Roseateles oligotrophus]